MEPTNSLDEIQKKHNKIEEIRSSLDYDIDGDKVNDLTLQKRLETPLTTSNCI